MFGMGKSAPTPDPKREAEIERAKDEIRKLVHELRDATADQAEKLSQRVKDRCSANKYLPFDFKTKAYKMIRELECNANMRAADTLIHQAARLAAEENMRERTSKMGESRRYFGKACLLGADQEWRKAYQRLSENVMMTGGVHRPGPTRAKPLDTAPKNPNQAKMPDAVPKPTNRAKY